MALIGRKDGRLHRLGIVAIAAAVTGIMGVKGSRVRAVSFGDVALQGSGRATLKVVQAEPVPLEGAPNEMQVFARLTYASELSRFDRGLYTRTTFTMPSTRETGVLVIDVDRSKGAKQWDAASHGLAARFYTLASKTARVPSFDGSPASGSLALDASVVGAERAGFRITGWLELRDPGADRIPDTADDASYEIDIELESVPPPEEITGQTPRPPHEPVGGQCDPALCWEDDGYYDTYWYGPGCGDADVGYETTDDGCSSDTVDDGGDGTVGGGDGGGDGVYDPYDPSVTSSDGGCGGGDSTDGSGSDDTSDSSGCDGSDDSSSSSDGCDGGDDSSSSGCDDSSSSGSGCSDSSSSGCSDSASSGCSGCEGDTLERASGTSATRPASTQGDAAWISVLLFLGSLGAAVRRRD